MIERLSILAAVFLLAALANDPGKNCAVRTYFEGSVPPVFDAYKCTGELDGQPFDEQREQACLHSIASLSFITDATVDHEQNPMWESVNFHLKSPSLRISQFDFNAPTGMRTAIDSFFSRNPQVLRLGDIYDQAREKATIAAFGDFFRSRGQAVGIWRRISLNYQTRIAQVHYEFWVGPEIPMQPPLPFYREECKPWVRVVNETDVDDYASLPVIDQLNHEKVWSCLSDQMVQSDQDNLKKSGAFTEVSYSVSGLGDDRSVSIRARGRPMRIARIMLTGYGSFAGKVLDTPQDLPLRVGQTYSSDTARAATDALTQEFTKSGQVAQVFESDGIEDGNWSITFGVLAYPESEVYIDGHPIKSAADLTVFRKQPRHAAQMPD